MRVCMCVCVCMHACMRVPSCCFGHACAQLLFFDISTSVLWKVMMWVVIRAYCICSLWEKGAFLAFLLFLHCHSLLNILTHIFLYFSLWEGSMINLYYSLGIFSRRQIDDIFLIFPRKQELTFHANCQFVWNVISCFLRKIRKIFQNVICWNFYPEC